MQIVLELRDARRSSLQELQEAAREGGAEITIRARLEDVDAFGRDATVALGRGTLEVQGRQDFAPVVLRIEPPRRRSHSSSEGGGDDSPPPLPSDELWPMYPGAAAAAPFAQQMVPPVAPATTWEWGSEPRRRPYSLNPYAGRPRQPGDPDGEWAGRSRR